jgi:hypothetical protein
MNADEVRFLLRDRWKAVEDIERQELRASTIQENWIQLNLIMRRAIRLHLLSHQSDSGEMEVFQRWAKLKVNYETSR